MQFSALNYNLNAVCVFSFIARFFCSIDTTEGYLTGNRAQILCEVLTSNRALQSSCSTC